MTQICRTCFQETSPSNYFEISNDERSLQIKIQMLLCIPEIDLNLLTNPVVCTPCLATLSTSYQFKKQCLYSEERIRSYLSTTNIKTGVKILDVYKSCGKVSVLMDSKPSIISPPKVERSYIDDLNDLLDDALGAETKLALHSSINNDITEEKAKQENFIIHRTTTSGEDANGISPTPVKKIEKWLYCKTCLFRTKNILVYRSHHKDICKAKEYHCDMCRFKTKYKQSLTKHKIRHKNHELLQCSKCDFKSFKKDVVERHDLTVHGVFTCQSDTNGAYVCTPCQYTATDMNELKKHISVVHKRKLHLCVGCKKVFPSALSLNRHLAIHQNLSFKSSDGSRKCTLCAYATDNRYAYASHMKKHTMHKKLNNLVKDKPLKCNLCNFKTMSAKYIKVHLHRVHKDASSV